MSEVPSPALSSQPPRSHAYLFALALFCLAVLPFLPALHGEFLWDDQTWLQNNPAVHAWNGLLTIWNPFIQGLHFYPATFTMFWLEHKIWGLDTTGYHLVNMLLHACSALLLWRILDRLGFRAAWLAALLWAIHPVQVDSVDWIVERKNTLSGLFYFLSAWSYLRFENIKKNPLDSPTAKPQWLFYAASILFYIIGLLAKTVICTLPAALLLLLWWKRARISLRQILTLSILLIIGLAIALFTARQEQWVITVGGAQNLSFTPLNRIVIAGRDVWFYLHTLLFPYPLMSIYPRWDYAAPSFLNIAAPTTVLLLLALLFLLRKRITRAPFFAFAFFLVTLSPGLGFINFYTMHFSFVANHYQYLACIGILAPLAEILFLILRRIILLRPTPAFIIAALLILALAPLTAFYATLFQSNMNMWKWNVEQNPAAFTAQHNLGIAYMNAGDLPDAEKHIAIALNEQPNDDFIQTTYGRICRAQGNYAEALHHFNLAIQLRPTMGSNYDELAKTYQDMHQPQQALAEFAKAVEVDGDDPNQHSLYAAALAHAGQPEQAIKEYQAALARAPGNMIIRYNFANLLLDLNRYSQAIDQYKFILQTDDTSPLVWHNLAAAYYQSGQIELALAAKKKANDLDAKLAPPSPPPPPATIP